MDVALVLPPDLYDDPGPLPPGPECAALWTALWADGGATDAAETTGAGADRVGCLDGSNAAGRGLTTGASAFADVCKMDSQPQGQSRSLTLDQRVGGLGV